MANPPSTPATLHLAALAHLARYATTRAGLIRVLDRRVDRWARTEAPKPDAVRAAKAAVREVVARLVASGAVDDMSFAETRARSLTRAGRSRRAVAAHLAARGVAAETVRQSLPEDAETELTAAVAFARRRRIGPFRAVAADAEARHRELGMMARAGFAQEVATAALQMQADAAETLVNRLRQS